MKKEQEYDNGTDFNFISNLGEQLGKKLIQLNKLVFGVIESKPYVLNWVEIEEEYLYYLEKHGDVNINDFSFNYVLGHSLINGFSENEAQKEAMYLHLRAELLAKKASGKFNKG